MSMIRLLVLVILVSNFCLLISPVSASYQGYAVYVPAGTPMSARTEQPMGSQFSQVGDSFTATLSSPIYGSGGMVAPPGSKVIGNISAINPPGRAGEPASMELRIHTLMTPDGKRIPLSASIDKNKFKLQADGGRISNMTKATAIGAGSGALGGLIGSAIGGGSMGKTTAIGTGIGAGVGILGGAIRKGEELVIKSGTELPFLLDQAITLGAPSQGAYGQAPGFNPPPQQAAPAFMDPGSRQMPPAYGGYGQSVPPPTQQPSLNPYLQTQPLEENPYY